MSVHFPKRRFFVSLALVFSAAPLFALYPSARNEARMVYSPSLHRMVLFGGSTPVDRGTKVAYELNDTWERTGVRWIQRFPAHNPGRRSAHVMVYDSNRNRILLFGGRTGTTAFSDTWVYENDDWKKIDTPNAPSPRFLAGGAFDPIRDRFIIFGGNGYSADAKTTPAVFDTWEFDGTTWTQRGGSGPQVNKPILVYDAARDQTLMLGLSDTSTTLMYQYDPAATAWKQLTPSLLPTCANEGVAVYDSVNQKVFYTGGVCTTSTGAEENLEWDGTTWTKIEVLAPSGDTFGAAGAFDSDRNQVVLFGGTDITGITRPRTLVFNSPFWFDLTISGTDPAPRSLFTFVTDPVNSAIWMFGGIDDQQTFGDFWKYQNGHWEEFFSGAEPVDCIYPLATYDTERKTMVLLCATSTTYEFDGNTWKGITGLKETPPIHRFGMMVYDQNLKKTVFFGGFSENYYDQTWTWDGTVWTRVKKNPPPPRALAAMWYDPTLKKTVLYGGLGRQTTDGRLVRFGDMWTFDGTGWTELKLTGATPGPRYGPQVAVDPRTNKVVLFGGLRVDTSETGVQTQVYSDDTWEWDGTAWTKLNPALVPPARENAGLTFDPIRNELVMFSGFAGTYHADTWTYTNGAWRPRIENVTPRRRSAR
ncbi:MAG: kelch repeat-containing protein [Acidobacteriota bacterium]